jgi:hypothetical protein
MLIATQNVQQRHFGQTGGRAVLPQLGAGYGDVLLLAQQAAITFGPGFGQKHHQAVVLPRFAQCGDSVGGDGKINIRVSPVKAS